MRGASRHLLVRLQPFQGELTDRLQHAKPRLAVETDRALEEALLDEGADQIEDGGGRSAPLSEAPPYVLGRLQRAAAGEDGELAKERLLSGGQQFIAPGDGVAHRGVARRRIPGALHQ